MVKIKHEIDYEKLMDYLRQEMDFPKCEAEKDVNLSQSNEL